VNRACDQLLAGSCFPLNQHCGIGGRTLARPVRAPLPGQDCCRWTARICGQGERDHQSRVFSKAPTEDLRPACTLSSTTVVRSHALETARNYCAANICERRDTRESRETASKPEETRHSTGSTLQSRSNTVEQRVVVERFGQNSSAPARNACIRIRSSPCAVMKIVGILIRSR